MLEELREAKLLLKELLDVNEEALAKLPPLYRYEAKRFKALALELNLR